MKKQNKTRYWIAVASKNHVERGVKEEIAQVCHGKASPLKRLKQGDWLLYYSSKLFFESPEPCQAFTAIGQVADDTVYQFDMGGGFLPFRRNIKYYPCNQLPIKTLIDQLSFIKNKQQWGYVFRFGLIEIPENDFKQIAQKMLLNPKLIEE